MIVGKSVPRVDAYEKVTGRAKYTDDLLPTGALVAKVVHSTVANGLVTGFDLSAAEKVPGVVAIFTCFDVPDVPFPTAGHPWSVEEAHQDIADRKLLNARVRYYGDDVAVVVAEDEVAAAKAAALIKVEYEEYPVVLEAVDAIGAPHGPLHEAYPDNVIKHVTTRVGEGDYDTAVAGRDDLAVVKKTYRSQVVQHCHIEVPVSHAWMENGRIIVVASTQIPHIARRVIHQATGFPHGKIRVIKPYIGGGFGNKQDILYEPLNAWLTTKLGGRCVKLELSREETMVSTRVRHAMRFDFESAITKEGRLVARRGSIYSNGGGYASHGHPVCANASNVQHMLYQEEKYHQMDAYTVYTNLPCAGAMRGYGIPQSIFAAESHMDDLAAAIGVDPMVVRRKNAMQLGYVDPGLGITSHTNGLMECLDKGAAHIGWDEKRKAYQNQTGTKRRGVGMAIFCYKTALYPIALETSSCRIVLNQDGSVQVQMGATEIGQGADTVFAQMAAETIGISLDKVNIISTQDTDTAPFDPAAYGSRQSYVCGKAVVKTAKILKEKIIEYAAEVLKQEVAMLDIENDSIVQINSRKPLRSVAAVAEEAFYSIGHSVHITAEATSQTRNNTFALGCCFAEVEVDIPLGKVKVLNIINVHDSGNIINPQLATAQVHGGQSMGLGYGLAEQLLFDEKGKTLNGNLLDYKLPTSLDTPELDCDFVETDDPTGPFGNKALGEPPTIPVAAALRNAVLHATGVAIDTLPLTPQKLVAAFTEAGLISAKGGK